MRAWPGLLVAAMIACVALISKVMGAATAPGPGIGAWVAAEEAEVRLVSALSAIAPDAGLVDLGIQLRLSEGWRIYWRTPGAAGMPPEFDWTGSENLASVTLRWPAPARFEAYGQQSYGYTGEVLFPATARLARPGEALSLRLTLAYLICREVCMPGEAVLALDLPAGAAAPTEAAAEIARHARRVPVDAAEAGVAITARRKPGGVTVIARSPEPLVAPDLFLEWPVEPGHRRPELPVPSVTLGEGGREARFSVVVRPPLVRAGTPLAVTVTDGARAFAAAVLVEEGD